MNQMRIIDQLISQHVNGKTFADIGPLWETVNEKISVAHHAGATKLMAIDQFPENDPHWDRFHARMKEQRVFNYAAKSINLLDYKGEGFDVINCGGVLYHAADPIHLLKKLKELTKYRLILTSTITPNKISNEDGEFILPEGAMVFVPALSLQNKKITSRYWNVFLGGRTDGGLTNDTVWDVENYNHWWWLFTPCVLDAMCISCGFKINRTHAEHDLYTMDLSMTK